MDPVVFWTAVGAVATCIAAAATVYASRNSKSRAKYLRMEGRWIGGFNDQWDLVGELRIFESKANGRFRWTLVECPPGLPWAKHVGRHGHELVEGSLEMGILACSGTKVADGDGNLITLANYTIPLPAQDGRYEGKSTPQKSGKWEADGKLLGNVSYLRKAPAYFES